MSRKKKTPHKWHKDSFKGICWSANWICLANNWSISLCHSQLTCSQRCYLCTSSGAPEHFGSWLSLPHPTASGSVAGTRGQPCAKRNLDPACNVQSYPLLWFNNLLFVEVPLVFICFHWSFFRIPAYTIFETDRPSSMSINLCQVGQPSRWAFLVH